MASAGIALNPTDDIWLSPLKFRSPHCLQDSILIYLSLPGSPKTPLRVLESDSIASVKLRIQTCKGVVVKRQRLVFAGRELARNRCLVRDYGVGDGNVLHLVVRLSDLRSISVTTVSGKTFAFRVDGRCNVGYVKERVRELVSFEDQRLVYDGVELDEDRVIDDIWKDGDVVINLFVRKSGKVHARPVDKGLELHIVAPILGVKHAEKDVPTQEFKQPEKEFWVEPVVGNPNIVLSPIVKDLVGSTFAGLNKGFDPIPTPEGSGGAYFMRNAEGKGYVGVFKPVDEEPMAKNNPRGLPLSPTGEGLKRGTRVGEGALREVAAYVLDHPIDGSREFLNKEVGFAGVPPTVMVRCLHKAFNHPERFEFSEKSVKIGSLQMFVGNNGSCEDIGPRAFPVSEVHKISVLDLRLANADRHGGNILIRRDGEDGRIELIPIDHGYCLPENFEDCTFEWLYWPQAREPYNSKTIEYIKSLNAEDDIALLKYHGWELSVECARTLRISTMLLKKGAERGLTPFAIGNMMCRETVKKKSAIEEIVAQAKDSILSGCNEAAFMDAVSEIMDRHLDELTV